MHTIFGAKSTGIAKIVASRNDDTPVVCFKQGRGHRDQLQRVLAECKGDRGTPNNNALFPTKVPGPNARWRRR